MEVEEAALPGLPECLHSTIATPWPQRPDTPAMLATPPRSRVPTIGRETACFLALDAVLQAILYGIAMRRRLLFFLAQTMRSGEPLLQLL